MSVTNHPSIDDGPVQAHISGEEPLLVGIIFSYLQLCPSGATGGEIRDYLSRLFKERRKNVVERLLYSLPVLFKAEDASGNASRPRQRARDKAITLKLATINQR